MCIFTKCVLEKTMLFLLVILQEICYNKEDNRKKGDYYEISIRYNRA